VGGAGHQGAGLPEDAAHKVLGLEAGHVGGAVVHGGHEARVGGLLEGRLGGDALDEARHLFGFLQLARLPGAGPEVGGAVVGRARHHHLGIGEADARVALPKVGEGHVGGLAFLRPVVEVVHAQPVLAGRVERGNVGLGELLRDAVVHRQAQLLGGGQAVLAVDDLQLGRHVEGPDVEQVILPNLLHQLLDVALVEGPVGVEQAKEVVLGGVLHGPARGQRRQGGGGLRRLGAEQGYLLREAHKGRAGRSGSGGGGFLGGGGFHYLCARRRFELNRLRKWPAGGSDPDRFFCMLSFWLFDMLAC
jgi:hypothetical protein